MGRPNYNNRKIEGVKLGQAVAKDLIKRISLGLGSRAAIRDPVVELEISGKSLGNDGFAEMATALVTSIEYKHTEAHGKLVKLEELCLRDNKLDISVLPALGQVIRLAAQDLRDLDLSNNLICVGTNEDAQIFQDFLRCFADCCVLRRIDLSGNALGSKAFEMLAKIYLQEEPVDLLGPEDYAWQLDHDASKASRSSIDSEALGRRFKNLGVSPDVAEDGGETNSNPRRMPSVHEKFRRERKSAAKAGQPVLPVETPGLYETTRGLRSVPYIVLSETAMTETCALHLSYVVSLHCMPEQLLQRVPPARAGTQAQQLVIYDSDTRSQGIIYYPNADLGSTGTKLLQLSEAVRKGLLDELDEATGEANQHSTPAGRLGTGRRTSDFLSSPLASAGRRRSGAAGATHDHEGSEMKTIAHELERLRHRVQGNALRDAGATSNDLWRTSLKMLRVGRALCPCTDESQQAAFDDEKDVAPARTNGYETFVPATDPSMALPATPLGAKTTSLAHRNPNQPLTLRLGQEWRDGKLVLTPIRPSPASPTASTIDSPPTPPPPNPPPAESPRVAPVPLRSQVPYRTHLPCGFQTDVWRRIVAYAVGADGIVSAEQQAAIMRWAMDRRTLSEEVESLGKLRSAQIWKVLDATGCLAYATKV